MPKHGFCHIEWDSTDLKKATQLGGKVAVPKTQIDPKVGWYAHLTDPDGNTVGLFQSARK